MAVNSYTENWSGLNANWAYDGSEDFAGFPGFLSSGSNNSTNPTFTPGPTAFDPWPRNIATWPFRMQMVWRALSSLSVNQSIGIITIDPDGTFSADFIQFNLFRSNVDGHLYVEVLGQKAGNSVDDLYDTGLIPGADFTFDVEIEITDDGFDVLVEGVSVHTETGWTFPTVGYLDISVQRPNASNRGLLGSTVIFTDEPAGTIIEVDASIVGRGRVGDVIPNLSLLINPSLVGGGLVDGDVDILGVNEFHPDIKGKGKVGDSAITLQLNMNTLEGVIGKVAIGSDVTIWTPAYKDSIRETTKVDVTQFDENESIVVM